MKALMSPNRASNSRSGSKNGTPSRSASRGPTVLLPAPPGPTRCTTLLRLRCQSFSGPADERREDLRGDVPVVHAFVDFSGVHEEPLSRFVRRGLAVVVER